MQLSVGSEAYGLYYNLLNITLVFQFINDFGIQNFTNRFVSQNRERIQLQYKDFAGLKIALSFIYILAVFGFVGIMNYEWEMYPFIFHVAFNQILISAIFFVRSNISGLGFYKMDSFFSVLDRILLIFMGSFLLYFPYFQQFISIETFVWIQTISLSITLVATIYFIKKKQLAFSFLSLSFLEMKKILRACLPFALIFLFSSLYNKLDVVLIGKLLEDGNYQIGVYAASMRLFEACSMISLAFGSLLLAMFSSIYTDKIKLQDLFKMAMNALVVITILIVMMTSFYPNEIMGLLYRNEDPYWTNTFQLTMFAFIPASLNYIFGAFIAAIHKEKPLVWFYAIASLISFVVNIWLILHWKVVGAAFAAIATHTILFIIQYIFIRQQKLLELNPGFWFRIGFFILISVLISFSVQYFSLHWIFKIVASSLGILILAWMLRMFSIKDFVLAKIKHS